MQILNYVSVIFGPQSVLVHACFYWSKYYLPKSRPVGLQPTLTIHSGRRTSLSNLQFIAVTQQSLSCILDFLYKKYGETYQSVKLNAPNFSLIIVAAHSWWYFKTDPIPPYVHWHFNTYIINKSYLKVWPATQAIF